MIGTAKKLLLLANSGEAPVVEQGTGNQTTGGATSDTATFANTTVTGRGVIVVLALKGARQVSTITDNKSNTYVRVGRAADSTDCSVEMWYCQPITGGASHTITVTFDGTTYCVWGAVEVSRVQGGGAFLDTRTINTKTRGGSGSSAAVSITSGLPRSANELFIAMMGVAGGGADAGIDTPTNWTDITLFQDYDGTMAGMGNHRINASANTISATWTNDTTTSPYAAIIAGFRGTNAVSGGSNPAPVNTVLPAITGTATVGQTLTASTGTWSNSPTSYTYQWKADGTAISGAAASTYVLTSGESGKTITVTVTAYNDGNPGVDATSAGVGPVAVVMVLDSIAQSSANITGAYSAIRRLKSTWTGALIRVQRSSDSTEQDIGYGADNLLDTTALLAFVGAGTGKVVKWYNQAGSSAHDLSAAEPKIVQSGALETAINSNPSIYFDGTGDFFVSPVVASGGGLNTFISAGSGYTMLVTARPTAGGANADATAYQNVAVLGGYTEGYQGIFIKSGTPARAQFYNYDGSHDVVGVDLASALPDAAVLVIRHTGTGGTLSGYVNGGTGASTSSTTNGTTSTNRLGVGAGFSGSTTLTGHISEVIVFNRPLVAADTNLIGASMALYAGETWSNVS